MVDRLALHSGKFQLFVFCWCPLLLSSSTRKRFCRQQKSGQTSRGHVVAGVFPFPRYMPSILSRIGFVQHSHFSASCFVCCSLMFSNFAPSRFRFRASGSSIFKQEKVPTSIPRTRYEVYGIRVFTREDSNLHHNCSRGEFRLLHHRGKGTPVFVECS